MAPTVRDTTTTSPQPVVLSKWATMATLVTVGAVVAYVLYSCGQPLRCEVSPGDGGAVEPGKSLNIECSDVSAGAYEVRVDGKVTTTVGDGETKVICGEVTPRWEVELQPELVNLSNLHVVEDFSSPIKVEKPMGWGDFHLWSRIELSANGRLALRVGFTKGKRTCEKNDKTGAQFKEVRVQLKRVH